MKNLFLSLITLLLTATSFANSNMDIPPYAGDIKEMRFPVDTLIQLPRLMPKKNMTPEEKAKLEDAKQRFRNGLAYLDKTDAIRLKHNETKTSNIQFYDQVIGRAVEIFRDMREQRIYDKEFLSLTDKIYRRYYQLLVGAYQEKNSTETQKIIKEKIDRTNFSVELSLKTANFALNYK